MTKWPKGLACLVVKELKEIHEPDNLVTDMDREHKVEKIKVSAKDHPNKSFKELS